GLLLSFAGGPDLTLGEVNEAATIIARQADPNAMFKFGLATLSDDLVGKAKVTVIATGIKASASSPGWLSGLSDKISEATSGRRR
ncbi:MAG: cell division protein FtsZ, partial [Chloroflexi bacterium]|nr:cell division protein FtsZ [Chloroflexota bacterium]